MKDIAELTNALPTIFAVLFIMALIVRAFFQYRTFNRLEIKDRSEQPTSQWSSTHITLPSGTEASVINDIVDRQIKGISKYGTTVADNPLDLKQWLQHAYEECLDQAIYLKRAIQKLEESK